LKLTWHNFRNTPRTSQYIQYIPQQFESRKYEQAAILKTGLATFEGENVTNVFAMMSRKSNV
jgi:hypothetical protein